MATSDLVAWYGAVLSTITAAWTFVAFALGQARLKVSATANMHTVGGGAFSTHRRGVGGGPHVFVEVVNIGGTPTTLTHLVGQVHASRLRALLRRAPEARFVVPLPLPGRIPHLLPAGERWTGVIDQDELEAYRGKVVFIGLSHSLARNPVWVELKGWSRAA